MDALYREKTSSLQDKKEEIIRLLSIKEKNQLEELYAAARKIREQHFGNKIFAYGFVYFSTYCKNDCNFCYYRRSNNIHRYRKNTEQVIEIAKKLAGAGVNLIDLTMGEDVAYEKEGYQSILEIIKEIKESTGLPIMISPGVVPIEMIDSFYKQGVDWFALYQETHNRALFEKLRVGQDYDIRMQAKMYAKKIGMCVEEGILSGIGETLSDIAESILMMGEIGAKQTRVMSFVPQKGIPMEHMQTPERELELKIISILRLTYPEALIPASLDVDGIAGLQRRIDAGANLVTSIIPPKVGLAGVAQSDMDVDSGGRTLDEVAAILKRMNLRIATVQEYKDFIKK